MSSRRITIRVDAALEAQIEKAAHREGVKPAQFVRESVERRVRRVKPSRRRKESVYEIGVRTGFIGAATGLPTDLSTNKKYFVGFGT
jgi:hypothetical protein